VRVFEKALHALSVISTFLFQSVLDFQKLIKLLYAVLVIAKYFTYRIQNFATDYNYFLKFIQTIMAWYFYRFQEYYLNLICAALSVLDEGFPETRRML
jgi:hypothetical protein